MNIRLSMKPLMKPRKCNCTFLSVSVLHVTSNENRKGKDYYFIF